MIIKRIQMGVLVASLVALTGCATLPTGPGVLVLPAPGKPIEEFQAEDVTCRQWAAQQIGMTAQDTVNTNTVKGSVVGTALGAGAGALLGAASGHAGGGAAIGAGTGLLLGTAVGAGGGQEYGYDAQRRYDFAYVQCMYSKGNQIPNRVHNYRIREIAPPSGRDDVPPDYIPDTRAPK